MPPQLLKLNITTLLARSAGFFWVGSCLQVISSCTQIFCTRLSTNCSYWRLPLIQKGATVLSSHPLSPVAGIPSGTTFTFTNKIVTIWAEINSRWGIVKPCHPTAICLGKHCSHLCYLNFRVPVSSASHANFSQHTERYKHFPPTVKSNRIVDTCKLAENASLSQVWFPFRKGYNHLITFFVPPQTK